MLLLTAALFTAQAGAQVLIQAEDYDAYYDTTPGNTGGAYRSDGVDIEATGDSGGGFNVGWIDANEWLAFNNLNIPASGSYTIRFRVASMNGGTLSNDLNGGSIVLGSLNIPNTGGWQNWTTISHTVNINAGNYSLGVFAVTGGWNLNWIEVVSNNPGTGVVTLYQHCSFGGYSANLQAGSYTLSQLQALGIQNDDISSLRVASGYKATLYQHHDFTGNSIVKTADDDCLVNEGFNDDISSLVVEADTGGPTDPGEPGTANGTHKRLKIVNGCGQDMWIQWLTAPGIAFNAPNRHRLSGLGSFIEYDIPDRGLSSMRFWPGFGCDAGGHNCRIGASGGPAELGFTCPPEGCAPPIDSKFEATFGCIPGVADSQCAQNPSAPGQPLGRGDWWNSSMVDGYTAPVKVQVHGHCPVGPQPAPVFGPGGPPGGVIDCSTLSVSDCPTNEDLSTNGQFPHLSNVNLLATNPATGAVAGCYSPSAKLSYSHWAGGFQTYPPDSPQAQMYACPTPPISPEQCMAGPADSTDYRNMIHSHCDTYAYPYDDGVGLSSCPSATNLVYEVTFYCPQ
ncbi:MAG TPA: carbohydrate-binding protein [Gammaproteobacteria bacterium]